MILTILFMLLSATTARSETPVRLGFLGAGPEIFDYEISVMRLALEHSGEPVRLELVVQNTVQERLLRLMESGRAEFDVFFTGFSEGRERRFHQVDIPLSRGLLGHRVFVINQSDQIAFAAVETLDELKQMSWIGSGIGWPDTVVFQEAGFRVMTADYGPLWNMLRAGRFNAFNRGVHEAFVEIDVRKDTAPGLMVEKTLMVRYRFDYMFYLTKKDRALGKMIERGLQRAYQTGAFMENFNAHPAIRKVMADARPGVRRIFDVENPLMTDRQRAIPEAYWHRFDRLHGVKEAR